MGRGARLLCRSAHNCEWAWGKMELCDVLEESACLHLCASGVRSDSTRGEIDQLLGAIGAREAEHLPPESRLFDGDGHRRAARNAFVLNMAPMTPVFSVCVKAGAARKWAESAALAAGHQLEDVEKTTGDTSDGVESRAMDMLNLTRVDFEELFEVVPDEAARRRLIGVTEALAKVVRVATSCNPPAVFVVPYYAGDVGLGNARFEDTASLLMRQLASVGYRGPLIHVGVERWEVHDLGVPHVTFDFRYPDAPLDAPAQTQACMTHGRLTTHAIGVRASPAGSESLDLPFRTASLVACAIAEGSDTTKPKCLALAVLYNGDRHCLHGIAANARQGIPLLVLSGSGGLSDFLPGAYVRRADASFNSYTQLQELGRKCRFTSGVTAMEVSLLRTVLDGRIVTHRLDDGPHVLGRVLSREFEKEDRALSDAKVRRAAYWRAKTRYERPARVAQLSYLIGGVVITLFTSLDTQLGNDVNAKFAVSKLSNAVGNGTATPSNDDYDQSTTGQVFTYLLAALPVLLSALLSLRKDLNHAAKAVAFNYGAMLVDSQVWRYCTRTGVYSDLALAACGHEHDTPTARAALLADNLVAIGEQVVPPDAAPPKSIQQQASRRPASRVHGHGSGSWSRVVMPVNAGGVKPDDGSVLTSGSSARCSAAEQEAARVANEEPKSSLIEDGDTYMQCRVLPQLDAWQRRAGLLQRQLVALKIVTHLAGACGSVLALLTYKTWVAFTTSLVTALAAWDTATPVELQLNRAQTAARSLTAINTKWQATPEERRSVQHVRDALVEVTECAIMRAIERPHHEAPSAGLAAALNSLGEGAGQNGTDAPTKRSSARFRRTSPVKRGTKLLTGETTPRTPAASAVPIRRLSSDAPP